jgi:3',5'-cyclic AMP phosphodiesterase CpdA
VFYCNRCLTEIEVNVKLLHLSDLHIRTHAEDNKQATALMTYIGQHYPEHTLVITGDITDDGNREQYEYADRLLEPFAGRIYFCPGNHDYGKAGNFYSPERAARFDEYISRRFNQGGTFKGKSKPVVNLIREGNTRVMLIALDSNLETIEPFDFSCGEIGKYQLKELDTILSSSAGSGAVKVVFFHHHLLMHNNPFMELTDAKALARVIYGRVDLVLFGHKHEMKEWKNVYGIKHILASDNSPGKGFVKEITIDGAGVHEPVAVPVA